MDREATPEFVGAVLAVIAALGVGFVIGCSYIKRQAVKYEAAQYEFNNKTGESDFVWYGGLKDRPRWAR